MANKKPASQRASVRIALAIDCSTKALRNLMTEQCRISDGFATYYAGTRSQLIAAGFPERSLPGPKGRRTKLRIAPGGHCYQSETDAWLTPVEAGIELEIHWSTHGPGGCAHPALTEVARMVCCSVSYWVRPIEWQSKEMPVQHLLETERAVDYTMSPDKRWLYTPAFAHELVLLQAGIQEQILRGELMALQATPIVPEEADSASLDAERMGRSVIDRLRLTPGPGRG